MVQNPAKCVLGAMQKCANMASFEKAVMLQNENLLAKYSFDTAENEPRQARCKITAREPWCGIVSVLELNQVQRKRASDVVLHLVQHSAANTSPSFGFASRANHSMNIHERLSRLLPNMHA